MVYRSITILDALRIFNRPLTTEESYALNYVSGYPTFNIYDTGINMADYLNHNTVSRQYLGANLLDSRSVPPICYYVVNDVNYSMGVGVVNAEYTDTTYPDRFFMTTDKVQLHFNGDADPDYGISVGTITIKGYRKNAGS